MGLMASTQNLNNEECKLVNSGWMYKKGKIVSNWKKRYFELFDDGRLNYYSDEIKRTTKTHKGVADLSIIIGLNIVDNKNFEVITPTRIWCFQCKFKSECDDWIEKFKNVENSYLHHDHEKPNKRDYLNLSKNDSILKLIAKIGSKTGETILYSDQIIKINQKQKQQTRIMLLTNCALYNIKPNENNIYKKCQKRISFDKIPCCLIINNTQFQIDIFIYKTDIKNIKTVIKTLMKADIEIIYQREEDEKEFGLTNFEQDKDGDTLQDILPFTDYDNKNNENNENENKNNQWDDDAVEKKNKNKNKNKNKKNKKKLKVKDFTFISVIGRGTFGKILLVSKKDDNKIYAMKILKKTQIIASGQEKNINAEREVLKSIKHPFLMSLRYAFQTESKLYLVLDYYRGGELMFHLKRKRKFTEEETIFILCQICLGIGCLHSHGIVYRDLKPENILLDEIGNCCLCDFGLCKNIQNKNKSTDTFCGTPEYLAPEIIKEIAYDKNVDWWSFGILAFELQVGIVPFFSSSNTEMYKKITESPLMLASWISTDCQDLIKQLLQRDVTNRLGFINDVNDIKKHKWFKNKNINWQKVLNKEIEPPYKPEIENKDDETDMTCVENKWKEESTRNTIVNKPQSNQQELFRGFTYRGGDDATIDINEFTMPRTNTKDNNDQSQMKQLNEANEDEDDYSD